MSIDKSLIAGHFDSIAPSRATWYYRNRKYHDQIVQVCRPFLDPTSRVLELGCSTGQLLNDLKPGYGVGIDFSPVSIAIAQRTYPHLHWLCADVENLTADPRLAEPFDLIVAADLVTYLDDIQLFFEKLRSLMRPNSRLVVSLWNWMWLPILRLAERLHIKAPDLDMRYNWLSPAMITNLLELAGYSVVQTVPGLLFPYDIPPISTAVNALSYAPLVRCFTLLTTLVARLEDPPSPVQHRSVTVVIPTRNEAGHIAALVARTPEMGTHTELLFVDGNSTDGTVEEIHAQIKAHPERDIRFMPQTPPHSPDADTPPDMMLKLGKGDAVRKGFAAASGEIVMILDSDISVPPEELPKFYNALVMNKARMANGSRFVYNQESGAMRPLNRLGNVFFSLLFSWLLDQTITDTLCGTKALFKEDYDAIAANRSYFGDFDPFGDFDLLFGAAWLKHPIRDVPIHYRARVYGTSKVRVNVHGPLLGRMSLLALWKLKLQPLLTRNRPRPVALEQSAVAHPSRPQASFWIVISALIALWALLRWKRH